MVYDLIDTKGWIGNETDEKEKDEYFVNVDDVRILVKPSWKQ